MKFLTKAWIQIQLSSFAERISNVFARKTDIEAHCTQKATQGILGHVKLSNSTAITTPGEYALDAVEKNASVQGTLANLIQQTNSNLEKSFDTTCFKFLNTQSLPDTGLDITSKIFKADKPTAYMFLNHYAGIRLIIGFCYGGELQDMYGAQIILSPDNLNVFKVRALGEGVWNDWKTL